MIIDGREGRLGHGIHHNATSAYPHQKTSATSGTSTGRLQYSIGSDETTTTTNDNDLEIPTTAIPPPNLKKKKKRIILKRKNGKNHIYMVLLLLLSHNKYVCSS